MFSKSKTKCFQNNKYSYYVLFMSNEQSTSDWNDVSSVVNETTLFFLKVCLGSFDKYTFEWRTVETDQFLVTSIENISKHINWTNALVMMTQLMKPILTIRKSKQNQWNWNSIVIMMSFDFFSRLTYIVWSLRKFSKIWNKQITHYSWGWYCSE